MCLLRGTQLATPSVALASVIRNAWANRLNFLLRTSETLRKAFVQPAAPSGALQRQRLINGRLSYTSTSHVSSRRLC